MPRLPQNKIDFEIIVDDFFLEICNVDDDKLFKKKKVLSLINDFEDGNWRYQKFQSFIWDNIAETALSYKERMALIDKSHSKLINSAKNLRLTDESKDQKNQGSELAEIVLYGIMKHHYNAISLVPKIFYKQNSQDNAKGADSIHIVIENDKSFSIWMGEAKFYNSIEDNRLGEIISSIENSLKKEKLAKENSIITNISDLEECLSEDPHLCTEIKNLLSPSTSLDLLKPKLHIPILLLHECKLTEKQNSLSDGYKNGVKKYHQERAEAFFKKQVKKIGESVFKYSDVHFHLILFPVPGKKEIIDKFILNVKHYKNQ